jgi:hypothetical protein
MVTMIAASRRNENLLLTEDDKDDRGDYIIDGNMQRTRSLSYPYSTTLLTRKRAHSLARALPRTHISTFLSGSSSLLGGETVISF